MNKNELENLMSQATGTESYHRINFGFTEILITDGVKMFIENADAFWFVTDVVSYIPEMKKKAPNEYLFAIDLVVKDSKAKLIIRRGDDKTIIQQDYSYTDCPEGEWKFYYDVDSNVMLYYMEY